MTEKKYNAESQMAANKRWEAKNKEHKQYLRNRGNARSFARLRATVEDIMEIIEIFNNENENAKNVKIRAEKDESN